MGETDEDKAEVICAGCGYRLPETEAEMTKTGPMHWSCAERHYPERDHGDSVFPH